MGQAALEQALLVTLSGPAIVRPGVKRGGRFGVSVLGVFDSVAAPGIGNWAEAAGRNAVSVDIAGMDLGLHTADADPVAEATAVVKCQWTVLVGSRGFRVRDAIAGSACAVAKSWPCKETVRSEGYLAWIESVSVEAVYPHNPAGKVVMKILSPSCSVEVVVVMAGLGHSLAWSHLMRT